MATEGPSLAAALARVLLREFQSSSLEQVGRAGDALQLRALMPGFELDPASKDGPERAGNA